MTPVYTLITGGSSGIGKAMAEYCASLGMNLLLVSLPQEGLGKVAEKMAEEFHVKTDFLEIDLFLPGSPEEIYTWVSGKHYPVNILINNAGLAGSVIFEHSSLEYIDRRIQVNVRSMVMLTRLFLPDLKKQERAYILNVGSLSAFFSIPYKSIYSSTKSFVVNFSRALKYELSGSPVSIAVVCPNGVRTNPGTHARIDSHGPIAKLTIFSPEKVARISVSSMLKGKFMIIPGFLNKIIYVISKIFPVSIQQRILTKLFLKEVRVS